jgi:hypothetical protein
MPDEWSCMCDDDCPYCGARHMSPVESEDLTEIVVTCGDQFVVLRSPDTAEHHPNYREAARFATPEQANAYLRGTESG